MRAGSAARPSADQFAEGLAAAALALVLSGCSRAEARPQWIVIVDTNAPITGQIENEPHWADAAVDTLRIDVTGSPTEQFIVHDVFDWPLSFGVVPGDSSSDVVLRIRAFRASRALQEPDSALLAPPPSVAIDRSITLRKPERGVEEVGVLLDVGCMGVLSQFG